tara:strand:+ start:150 stop:551 length:402 start_codon:yes stop_codon:yes gene_type:complete
MTKFLRSIKPIIFVLAHLVALPRRFRIFMFTNTNLYWVKFGFESTGLGAVKYFSRSKDFRVKDWLLLPYYCFLKVATWLILAAYWLALFAALPFWIASLWDSIINIFIFVGWIGFLAELDQRLEINIWTDEIN